jgi:hypothetical protein
LLIDDADADATSSIYYNQTLTFSEYQSIEE